MRYVSYEVTANLVQNVKVRDIPQNQQAMLLIERYRVDAQSHAAVQWAVHFKRAGHLPLHGDPIVESRVLQNVGDNTANILLWFQVQQLACGTVEPRYGVMLIDDQNGIGKRIDDVTETLGHRPSS